MSFSILVQPLWYPEDFAQYDEPFPIWWVPSVRFRSSGNWVDITAPTMFDYSDEGGLDSAWQTPHLAPDYGTQYRRRVRSIWGDGAKITGVPITVHHDTVWEWVFWNDDSDYQPWLWDWHESAHA